MKIRHDLRLHESHGGQHLKAPANRGILHGDTLTNTRLLLTHELNRLDLDIIAILAPVVFVVVAFENQLEVGRVGVVRKTVAQSVVGVQGQTVVTLGYDCLVLEVCHRVR